MDKMYAKLGKSVLLIGLGAGLLALYQNGILSRMAETLKKAETTKRTEVVAASGIPLATNYGSVSKVETDTGKKAYVKYHLGKTLRANNVYDYIEDLINLDNVLKKTDDLIIIVKEDPNDSLIKVLKSIWKQEGVFVVVHGIKRLQFNILEHDLVPSHRILNDDEAKAFKQKFNVSDSSQIPDIGRFSPVALAIGMRPEQICEIMRPSNTAIEVPFYRVCSP